MLVKHCEIYKQVKEEFQAFFFPVKKMMTLINFFIIKENMFEEQGING